jgi:hypothetical protein
MQTCASRKNANPIVLVLRTLTFSPTNQRILDAGVRFINAFQQERIAPAGAEQSLALVHSKGFSDFISASS